MGPGLPGQRSVLVDGRPARSSRSCGACRRARCAPRSGTGTVDMFARMAGGRDQGLLDHLHQPGRLGRQPQHRDRGPGGRRARHHPGRLRRDRDQRLRRHRAARRRMWAEADGVMINSERNLTLVQPAVDPPGQALPGLAAHRPRRLRDGLRATRSPTTSAEEVFEEIKRALRTRRPATTCAASPTTGCATSPVQWPRAAGRRRTATRSATSTTASARPADGPTAPAPAGVRRPRAAGPCSSPARTCRPPSCPTTTTRSSSTPAGCSTSGTR